MIPTCMMALSSVFMVHCTAGRKAESTSSGDSGAPDARTKVCSTSAERQLYSEARIKGPLIQLRS